MKTEPPQESANARIRLWDHMADSHDLYLTVSEIDDIFYAAATKNMKTEHDTLTPSNPTAAPTANPTSSQQVEVFRFSKKLSTLFESVSNHVAKTEAQTPTPSPNIHPDEDN